jgi:large subunit ribosomal protein L4
MVVGGGRKPWRQKGTGRARIGSLSSPILVGGGVAHGPTGLKNYTKKMPKKVRRMALRSILTDKVKGGALGVIEDIQMNAPKTKDALAIVNNIGGGRVLFIAADRGENTDNTLMDRRNRSARTALELSTRNLPNVKTLLYSNINPHDLMHYSRVVILESALPKIGEMLSNA